MMNTFKLHNGVEVPKLAFGTYQLPNNNAGYDALMYAIADGYRHIDTAASYRNEHLITKAIADSGLKREDFFICTKVWNADQGYEKTLAAFEKSCLELKTDYIDLYLIHWPIPLGHNHDYQTLNVETWQAMEQLYKEKRVRAIGVSNFLVHHLIALEKHCEILPMVNQIEFNPYYQQRQVVAYCQSKDILVEAWAPLMRGIANRKEELKQIANKYKQDINNICLRYCLQKGIVPILRALRKEIIHNQKEIFNFEISAEDMYTLDTLNTLTDYTFHPDRNDEWFE